MRHGLPFAVRTCVEPAPGGALVVSRSIREDGSIDLRGTGRRVASWTVADNHLTRDRPVGMDSSKVGYWQTSLHDREVITMNTSRWNAHTRDRNDRRGRRSPGRGVQVASLTLLVLAVGCASAGPPPGPGVSPRLLDMPPYYAGTGRLPDPRRIAHLPVTYQPAPEGAGVLHSDGAHAPLAGLIVEMNAFMDDLREAPPLNAEIEPTVTAPDVHFGYRSDARGGAATANGEPPVRNRWMALSLDRPSEEWSEVVTAALDAADRELLLVVTLEVGEYWPMQKGREGDRQVPLGTGHAQRLPRLTPLDRPVRVLQLTGAVLDPDGRAVRIGAEGVVARRGDVIAGGVDAQSSLTEDDVRKLGRLRRHDLSGKPLVWQVALENLVRQLTGFGVVR